MPRTATTTKRTCYLPTRMRTDERDLITAGANAAGLEVAAFMRNAALREARVVLAESSAQGSQLAPPLVA